MDVVASSNIPTTAEEWNAKYNAATTCVHFDWYLGYDELQMLLQDVLDRYDSSCEIFIPGCGLSELAFQLYDVGYENITNADISTVAVHRMSTVQHQRQATHMQCVALDSTQMPDVPNHCFDVILDKGLLDTLLCSPNNVEDVLALLHELHRVLKVNGTLVVVSHGPPDTRLMYLTRETFEWTVDTITPIERICSTIELPKAGTRRYYMYTCHRRPL
ncbi:hypothetical protein H257_09433 [Aphanomyces astaci]|uniref:Methyltransferase domain-containing protein n=1 Tax=Aphanomyces astaci TaxID=112090 RepID=W4GBR3_APHAT|nr:hypothetical protein H257_09433 [Aphanomyces astaci]ETV76403.1 hypothetical protein H257_09433 [Aphanomyces astaci]|eukprot:XP_009833948.1 hypothetical protein H257_09433 [Aphanomyces astaci]